MLLAMCGRAKPLIIILAVVLLRPIGWAQTPKIGSLLTASGVRPSEYWKKSDYISLPGEGTWHVALETMTVRVLDQSTHEVLLSSNGDLEFFDVKTVRDA